MTTQSVDDEIDKITPEIIFQAADKRDKLARDITEEAGQHTFGERARKTKILVTELGDNSPAIGAASLVLEKMFNPLSL